ncbi:MAG: RNA polymerase factor sigma-54 [Cyclonatronaceae bacterium]
MSKQGPIQRQAQRQRATQTQTQQQKLSPQQIQYIKMLQMSTQHIEQRIKEELESNPALEDRSTVEEPYDDSYDEVRPDTTDAAGEQESATENELDNETARELSDEPEVDWEAYHTDPTEGYDAQTTYNPELPDWQELPTPYSETQLEKLEEQVLMLDLDDKQQLIADQIIGSIDEDGYFRREMTSVADGVAFQNNIPVAPEEVEEVLQRIQRLDPPGIAARNLRECLQIQLEMLDAETEGLEAAQQIVEHAWEAFEKKHFDKIIKRLELSEDDFRAAYETLRMLDPKPGSFETAVADAGNYITPDFEVRYEPSEDEDGTGDFNISMNRGNMPDLVVSKSYEEMMKEMEARRKRREAEAAEKAKAEKEARDTQLFIKSKIESARWFMEMLRQRQQTLMSVMQTIVMLQESFFKSGKDIKPMILKDVAERVHLDISTISRVVNGKYVQTPFGVYELRYFFNEGVKTESGEEVSNLEVKNLLAEIIENEPSDRPYSDQKLMELLRKKGFKVARRTVSKYREQLRYPPARLRKKL